MIAFAEPLALALSALAGVLVLLYLWQQPRRRVVVPSLLLWEGVRDPRVRSVRFRPDWLFLLRLLLLLLLVFGLARPYWPQRGVAQGGQRHILVLDTTASMQAHEPGGTRFELARAQALSFLEGLAEGDEVMVIAAGTSPSLLCDATHDRQKPKQALAAAVPVDAGGDLGATLAFADSARQRSPLPAEVIVFSDQTYAELPAAARDRVTLFQIGHADDNVAIESVHVEQGRFQGPTAAHAQIQVRNFGPAEAHGLLTVSVDDGIVARHGFTLAAHESRRFQVSGFPRAGRLVAQLDKRDALPLDDTTWGWVREARPLRVLLVSPPAPLTNALRQLARAGGMRLTVVEPGTYREPSTSDFDVVIFHRYTPTPPSSVNALYIDPPANSTLFTLTGTATELAIIDWHAHHPVLQGLQAQALPTVARASLIVPPPGSEVLLRSRTAAGEAALAFAVERDQRRLACFGFDVEAAGLLGNDSPAWLLLFLGALDWLAPPSDDVVVTRTGVAAVLRMPPGPDTARAAAPLRVTDPRGRTIELDATSFLFEPLLAGPHEVQAGERKTWLLANFLDAQESSIAVPANVASPATRRDGGSVQSLETTVPPGAGNTLGSWLWSLAAALLVGEWWASSRRPGTRPS